LKDDLLHLIELQDIDLNISKLDDEIDAGNVELDKRRSSIEAHKATIANLEAKSELSEERRRELEAALEDEMVRIKDRQTKLMNVQTNREYQSLLKETEDGKKANKQREEEIVHIMEQVENFKSKIDEEANLCKGEEKLLAEEVKKLQKQADENNSLKETTAKKRQTKAKKVPESLLKKYDILRERRNGIAIVGVNKGVCHGCYMNIPPQLYNDLIKNERLLSCPTCSRIMYPLPDEEEA